jgi:hypothetical protein
MVRVTWFVIGKISLSQYPIELDSIQEEIGRWVWLLGAQELQNCGWIEAVKMGRS